MIDRFLVRIANAHFVPLQAVGAGPALLVCRAAADHQTCGAIRVVVDESWIARGMLATIVGLNVFMVYMWKLLNAWNGRFFNALQDKNADAFWAELQYLEMLVAIFIIAPSTGMAAQLLTIRWRRWLSEGYFGDWLADRTYYRMELTSQGTDNPEQRIEQDCANFTERNAQHLARPAPADHDARSPSPSSSGTCRAPSCCRSSAASPFPAT